MSSGILHSLMEESSQQLSYEIENELVRILTYWQQYTPDLLHGGFMGQIDGNNRPQQQAAKGSVLNARILWSFSAAYNRDPVRAYLDMASRAFEYLRDYLTDKEFGGLFWTVDYQGRPGLTHKQIYAQAFGIYGLSEYYKATGSQEALGNAIRLYELIETHSRDNFSSGYREAFSRDWSFLEDKRLSEKDENAPKTMNTHLHIVEAYANLYKVWPDEQLRKQIILLLNLFDEVIINPVTAHLVLFFSDDWTEYNKIISYGHDIESSWLLESCAVSINDSASIEKMREKVLPVTNAAMEGLDKDGGLWYEYNPQTNELISEKHWWPQAEALVGFCNAWQLSGVERYRKAMLTTWAFIKNNLLDEKNGEWFWGIRNNIPMQEEDKVGLWKCPYHNIRACLELLSRLKNNQTASSPEA